MRAANGKPGANGEALSRNGRDHLMNEVAWWPVALFALASLAAVLLLHESTSGMWWRSTPAFAAAVLMGLTARNPAVIIAAILPALVAIPFSNSGQSIPLVVIELFLIPVYSGLVIVGIAGRAALNRVP